MANRNWRWGTLIVVLVAVLFGLSYFGRTREPIIELVKPAQMYPGVKFTFNGDPAFGERVVSHSFFAVVLHRSEYSGDNANALESVRSWAANEFHKDPRFLHPVILPRPVASSTFLNATAYNVLAVPYYASTQAIAAFLSTRIEDYCQSTSFLAFADDYYDFLGKDGEAATLLARYQSERGKAAINPLLSLAYFVFAFALAPLTMRPFKNLALRWREPFGGEGAAAAAGFAYFLTCLGSFYLAQAVVEESTAAQSILAGIACGAMALYTMFPLRIEIDSEEVHSLRHTMSSRRVIVFAWVIVSLLCIQFLTWLKQGVLTNPDPLTLLICGFSGDFIHEPLAIKHFLATAIALAWSFSFAFTLRILARRGSESTREVQKKLEALNMGGRG